MTETISPIADFDSIATQLQDVQKQGEAIIAYGVAEAVEITEKPFGAELMTDAADQTARDLQLGELAAIKIVNTIAGEEGTGTTDPTPIKRHASEESPSSLS